jgi:hypothetical protein
MKRDSSFRRRRGKSKLHSLSYGTVSAQPRDDVFGEMNIDLVSNILARNSFRRFMKEVFGSALNKDQHLIQLFYCEMSLL